MGEVVQLFAPPPTSEERRWLLRAEAAMSRAVSEMRAASEALSKAVEHCPADARRRIPVLVIARRAVEVAQDGVCVAERLADVGDEIERQRQQRKG